MKYVSMKVFFFILPSSKLTYSKYLFKREFRLQISNNFGSSGSATLLCCVIILFCLALVAAYSAYDCTWWWWWWKCIPRRCPPPLPTFRPSCPAPPPRHTPIHRTPQNSQVSKYSIASNRIKPRGMLFLYLTLEALYLCKRWENLQ